MAKPGRRASACWRVPGHHRADRRIPPPGESGTTRYSGRRPERRVENTNYLGKAKRYSRLTIPTGGYIYPGFDLNHSYASAMSHQHRQTEGARDRRLYTGAMKNCFGMAPVTIYGSDAGVDEPALAPRGGRDPFHYGKRQPSKSAPQEKDRNSPRAETYRVPRIVVGPGIRPAYPSVHRRRHQVHDRRRRTVGFGRRPL